MLDMLINSPLFSLLLIILIVWIIARMIGGKPIAPKFILSYRHGDYQVNNLGADSKAEAQAKLRSPRLFKQGADDNSVIYYEDMTPQERHDAGFR